MQTEYRRLKFGLISANVRIPQVDSYEQILISYVKTSNEYLLQTEVEPTIDIFRIAREYVGPSFKNWLLANFENGIGARASLVRAILTWIKDDSSIKLVIGEINRDLNRLCNLKNINDQLVLPIVYSTDFKQTKGLNFDLVTDKHFFDLLAGIGPELTAILLLSLDGINSTKER